MIYLTLLLLAVLAYNRHRRKSQHWQRIRKDAAQWEGGES